MTFFFLQVSRLFRFFADFEIMTNFQGHLKVMLNLAKSLESNELFLMSKEFFIAENSRRTGNFLLERFLFWWNHCANSSHHVKDSMWALDKFFDRGVLTYPGCHLCTLLVELDLLSLKLNACLAMCRNGPAVSYPEISR
jgi:hypothetical protein